MSNANLRNITNNFLEVRLLSLASWSRVNDFVPRDRGGPYAVTQEGYDPEDPQMKPDEFILNRFGKWLSMEDLFLLPVSRRREEFLFGTAAEVMHLMHDLPPNAEIIRADPKDEGPPGDPDSDELVAAIKAAKAGGAITHLSW